MRQYAAIALGLSILMGNGAAFAQHRDDDHDHGPRYEEHRDRDHQEWRQGYRMDHDDWDRGRRLDYRAYRLSEPPRGYEWREIDGRYVLAAIATGIIANIIVNAH